MDKPNQLVKLQRLLSFFRSTYSPLARRLMVRIFAIYFTIAMSVTIVEILLQYGEELDKIQAEIAAAVQLVEPALSKTLWNIDKPATAAIAEGLSRNRALAGLRLDGDQSITMGRTPAGIGASAKLFDKGSTQFSKLYEQRFAIHHPESDRPDKVIGTLTVYSSSSTVVERAMNVLLAIIASAAVKTVALWLILYVTITGMVARPLLKLANSLNRINREHDTRLLQLPHWTSGQQLDELTFLLRSFVSMRGALRRSQQKLVAHSLAL